MSIDLDRLKAALSGRYAIEREIGRGGMTVVYLARDLKHRRDVAIKVLLPELTASLASERCSTSESVPRMSPVDRNRISRTFRPVHETHSGMPSKVWASRSFQARWSNWTYGFPPGITAIRLMLGAVGSAGAVNASSLPAGI